MSSAYTRPGYYRKRITRYTPHQIPIAKALVDLWHPSSVYDMGCGIGGYLEGFYRCGCTDIAGSDIGWEAANCSMTEAVRLNTCYHDATQPLTVTRKYDLAMSIDVAEHTEPAGSMTFCNNLVLLSKKRILLTSGPPGMSGKDHINLQIPQYWIDRIEACGGKYNRDETEYLIKYMKDIDEIAVFDRALVFHVEEK